VVCDVTGDLAQVVRSLEGCDLVVNASSYVGDNRALQSLVNVKGAGAVVSAASRLDIPIVHVSTAGVYGTLPYSGGAEGEYLVNPESSLSESRVAGEEMALDGDANILRPLFVTGRGDRHFLLPLLRAHLHLDAWIDEGRARLSVLSAEYLGEVTALVALRRLRDMKVPAMIHVVPPEPVTVKRLLSHTLDSWGRLPQRSVGAARAAETLERQGISSRKVTQFAEDYFIASSVLGGSISPVTVEPPTMSSGAARWYAAQAPGEAL
jgi:dTDP-4-dehydrorhamnose reductase